MDKKKKKITRIENIPIVYRRLLHHVFYYFFLLLSNPSLVKNYYHHYVKLPKTYEVSRQNNRPACNVKRTPQFQQQRPQRADHQSVSKRQPR